ncbi:MAG: S-methyl-5'-thioadenosine phosphorylase [Thermodesulfobacteriota bacterium]|nr:S-methyl-5'-thioadenosine phosphorylase [Thermodesulfobacteriota bacterium]MEE2975417.1 S-methyl-5'-thioadenosine phosphorylase [Thermodesulfobacteriota bacterium]
MIKVAIIGGSGFYDVENPSEHEELNIETPWGPTSDSILKVTKEEVEIYFLSRHGRGHLIGPSEINYRANIYALKFLGIDWIISVSAVGSMKEEIPPGMIVIPDQFIDFTKNRKSTFFDEGIVAHVSMAKPVSEKLSKVLYDSCKELDLNVQLGGTYLCIEGPQFSSLAESNLYRSMGVDVIGMTNMPEAKLAREAEMCYSTIALSTDYDCWHKEHESVTVEEVVKTMNENIANARLLVSRALNSIPREKDDYIANALKSSIISSIHSISEESKEKLSAIIRRYLLS